MEKKDIDETELYDLAELFKVFGDSTRIRILFELFEAERAALLSDCKVSKFGRIVQFYLCFFFLQWLCTVCGEGMGHTKTPDPYVLHRGGAFIVGQGKTLSY